MKVTDMSIDDWIGGTRLELLDNCRLDTYCMITKNSHIYTGEFHLSFAH